MHPDFIEIYDDAMPAELCQRIIEQFDSSGVASRGRTGDGVDVAKKDSFDLVMDDHPDWSHLRSAALELVLEYLKQYMRKYVFTLVGALSPAVIDPRTQQLVTITSDNFAELGEPRIEALISQLYGSGPTNVQKYVRGSGGYHHWHSEIYPKANTYDPLHRVLYYLFYLNDVEEGGETEFFYQQKKVQPRRGRLVIAPAGFTHTHKGHIPHSADKYIVTSWVMFQGVAPR